MTTHATETPLDAPVTMWSGEIVTVDRAIEILDACGGKPDTIRHRYGDWVTTDYGVECLSHVYSIA